MLGCFLLTPPYSLVAGMAKAMSGMPSVSSPALNTRRTAGRPHSRLLDPLLLQRPIVVPRVTVIAAPMRRVWDVSRSAFNAARMHARPTIQRVIQRPMFPSRHHQKIVDTVIVNLTIDVMYLFVIAQRSANGLFHHPAVFKHRAAIRPCNDDVSAGVAHLSGPVVGSTIANHVRFLARDAAIHLFLTTHFTALAFKRNAAVFASQDNAGDILTSHRSLSLRWLAGAVHSSARLSVALNYTVVGGH